MLNGTVSMSLADIDKLRQEVKEANEAKIKAEAELAEVKADKRTVLIERIRSLRDSDVRIYLPEWKVSALLNVIKDSNRNRHEFDFYHGGNYRRGYRGLPINQYVDIEQREDRPEEKTTYLNFDDIQQELRKKVEDEVNAELGQLRSDNAHHRSKISELHSDYAKELDSLSKKHHEELQAKDEVIAKWEKSYKELEEGKKEPSEIERLQSVVKDLQDALEKEKNKKWYQKF